MPWFPDHRAGGAPVNAETDTDGGCWRSADGRHEWEDNGVRLRNGMTERACVHCRLTRWFAAPKDAL
jgi:hypothetical protein